MTTGKIYKADYENIKKTRLYPFSGMPIYYKPWKEWGIVTDSESGIAHAISAGRDLALCSYGDPNDALYLFPGEEDDKRGYVRVPGDVSTRAAEKFCEYWDIGNLDPIAFVTYYRDLNPNGFAVSITGHIKQFVSWDVCVPIPPNVSLLDLIPGGETEKTGCNCGGPIVESFIGIGASGCYVSVCTICGEEQ
jgi:hypothetical protein